MAISKFKTLFNEIFNEETLGYDEKKQEFFDIRNALYRLSNALKHQYERFKKFENFPYAKKESFSRELSFIEKNIKEIYNEFPEIFKNIKNLHGKYGVK